MSMVLSRETISRRAKHPVQTGKGAIFTLERKDVFKSVLDNPFRIQWPSVPTAVQSTILTRLSCLFNGISDYHVSREDIHRRKRKAARQSTAQLQKKRKSDSSLDDNTPVDPLPSTQSSATVQVIPIEGPAPLPETSSHTDLHPPAALRHVTIGINEVTKRLESHIRSHRTTFSIPEEQSSLEQATPHPPIKAVFVCRADVNPPALVAHFPQLVAACNSVHSSFDGQLALIRLVPFPHGAEATLAAMIGLRRVAVLAIDTDIPGIDTIADVLSTIPVLRAAWLKPRFSTLSDHMEPTHVKQLRTSAPKDMKVSKELRAEGRATAKEKRRQKKPGVVTFIRKDGNLRGLRTETPEPLETPETRALS